jgi:hypothetical protein
MHDSNQDQEKGTLILWGEFKLDGQATPGHAIRSYSSV